MWQDSFAGEVRNRSQTNIQVDGDLLPCSPAPGVSFPGHRRAAFDAKSFHGAVATVQFEPNEVAALGVGQNSTPHPITDCTRADLEVLRDLYSGPPLFLRLRGFDCCFLRHVNVFDNNFCCVAVRLPGGPFDLGKGNATDHRPLGKRVSLQVDGSVKGAFQPDAGLLPAFHFGSATQGLASGMNKSYRVVRSDALAGSGR